MRARGRTMKLMNVAFVDSSIDATVRDADANVSLYIHIETTKVYSHLATILSAVFSDFEG